MAWMLRWTYLFVLGSCLCDCICIYWWSCLVVTYLWLYIHMDVYWCVGISHMFCSLPLSLTLSHSLSLSLIEICDDPVVSHDLIRGYSLLDIHFSERCDTLLVHFSDMWWPSCLFRPIRDSFKFQFGRVSFFKFH